MNNVPRWVFILFTFFFSAENPAFSEDLIRFQYGGRERSYHIHVPEAADGPLPLVVVLHGAMDNAFTIERISRFTDKAQKENFIVVYPNGTNEFDGSATGLTWNGGNCCGFADAEKIGDVAFIRELVEKISREHRVDPARIYAAGFSNGAQLAYRLGCEAADVFAAIAPVSGALLPECHPSCPVSVLAINGTADQKVLYNGGYSPVIYGSKYDEPVSFAMQTWQRRNGCDLKPETVEILGAKREIYSGCEKGSSVELYTIDGGDHEWPQPENNLAATDLIWEFFKAHPKK